MLRYLAVLAVMLTWFMGDVSAVTDQEFGDLHKLVEKQNSQISHLFSEMKSMASKIERQSLEMERQASVIEHQTVIINRLQSNSNTDEARIDIDETNMKDLVQNLTVEERVELLEIQVVVIQDEVSDLEADVDFLFEEQIIQDEKLLNLEQENDQTDAELDQIEDEIESLQDTTLALDFRVTMLEENAGGDGNSSISELEVRVETLEGTVTDHETRITSAEADVEGLQLTDINHDSRISALEENGGGGGGSQNETIAFHAVLTSYDTISVGSNVEFHEVILNEGNGYDNTTGVFTVPTSGGGLYYFSTYLLVSPGEYAWFDMTLNDDVICSAYGHHITSDSVDYATGTCSAIVNVVEGDEVKLVLDGSSDNTPLHENGSYFFHGFNGFRI